MDLDAVLFLFALFATMNTSTEEPEDRRQKPLLNWYKFL
jgi:hypothetical protein